MSQKDSGNRNFSGKPNEVRIMTLNPGHFHAALVQKNMLEQVDPTVYIYGPDGPDLEQHIERIEGFNSREESPTDWKMVVYRGDDYLERMIREKSGNVMVTAGNNRDKTEYIKKAVDNGINVLSDKPMVIDKEGWELLVEAFESAEKNGVLLYDIMTERNEITSMIQRHLAHTPELFGELKKGSPEDPSIVKESVHHLFKSVAGTPLRRPAWYFDVSQQGEGVVDVTTHLVDLTMWGAFPDRVIDHEKDVEMLKASRWPTVMSKEQFKEVTGESDFPGFLKDQLVDGELPYYCNGDMVFTINGYHSRISVIWDYKAPEGGNDTHFSMMRGTQVDLVIRQGEEQNYKPTLYVELVEGANRSNVEKALVTTINELRKEYPGIEIDGVDNGWKLEIPDEFYKGHEAHFGKVAQDYFGYLASGKLPDWEVPNMITKYYITSQARELAMKGDD